MDIAGKVVVVTGAAAGIGAALARRFMDEGAQAVVVSDLSEAEARKVAEPIGGIAKACDVSVEADVRRLVEFAEDTFGRIDLFCSNAGILGPTGGIEADNDQWHQVMQVNFMAHVYAARAVLPGMCRRGEGYLLQIASAAGISMHVGSAPYTVSKHAAVAWAEWMAMTYRPQGIGVSCVCPLGVRTDMLQEDVVLAPVIGVSALDADEVAQVTLEGLGKEEFLILPHENVRRHVERRAANHDKYLQNMSLLKQSLNQGEDDMTSEQTTDN